MNEFKKPILSQIYNAIGILTVVIGVILAVLSLIGALNAGLGPRGSGFYGLPLAIAPVIILLLTALIALPFFGIAQVITYFGRTAYHAQAIDEGLKQSLFQMQKTMTAISERVQVGQPPPAYSPQNQPPVQTVNCPYCNVAIPRQAVHKGSNTCPACHKDFDAG